MIMMKPVVARFRTVDLGTFTESEWAEGLGGNEALFANHPDFEPPTPVGPPALHGDSIRVTNPGGYAAPSSAYLIYFTMDDDTPHALHVYDSMITDRLEAEERLYALAKSGSPGQAKVGQDLEGLVWHAPTYISIVLDVDDHEFFWGNVEGYDPIKFIDRKVQPENEELEVFDYAQNKSFYDAERARLIDPVSGKSRPVLRFVNYYRNGDGGELQVHEIVRYCMDLQLLVRWAGGKVKLHIIDPDSENQGPDG